MVKDSLAPFVGDANAALLSAIEHAYERGHSDGYAKAQEELRQRVALALDYAGVNIPPVDQPPKAEPPKEPERKSPWSGPRAPRGSVRPAIIGVLNAANGPMKTPDIYAGLLAAGHTLIKEETIRSTLHKMAAENEIVKSGDGWVAIDVIDDTHSEPETNKGATE